MSTDHVNVKLVHAAEWTLHGLPQSKDKTDSGEGSLTTRQRVGFAVLPIFGLVNSDFQTQFLLFVVNRHLASVTLLLKHSAEQRLGSLGH